MELTPDQIERYRADGYLPLPGLFSAAEMDRLRAEADRLASSDLVHEDNLRTRFSHLADGTPALERIDPVTTCSDAFAAVARDARLLEPVRQLLGEAPLLFKDQLLPKPPGMGGYTAHQDHAWWQLFPRAKLLSVMVAIDAADAENGAMEMHPGRHSRLWTPTGEMRHLTDAECTELGLTDWQLIETAPGDVLVFHCLTPHRSGPNRSQRSRRQFVPSYNGAGYGDLFQMHYEHYDWTLRSALSDEARRRLFMR